MIPDFMAVSPALPGRPGPKSHWMRLRQERVEKELTGTTGVTRCYYVIVSYERVLEIQRVDGDGSRPAATLEFADTPYGSVEKISMRLHGMHWKGRELFVQTLSR